MPLFPLDIVVFPGMTVPLHVFEERYKRLVREVLAQDQEPKRFVIVWSRGNAPIRDTAEQLARFGTVVHVLSVEENEDGTYDLLVHGQERCEVHIDRTERVPEAGGEPRPLYFTEEHPAPIGRDDPNAEAVAAWDAVDTFRSYAGKRFRGDAEDEIDAHLPEDPFYQASFVCANILVPSESKQTLLEARSLRERLDLARTLMQERMEPRARARRTRT